MVSDEKEEDATFYATCFCVTLAGGSESLMDGDTQTIFSSITKILQLEATSAGRLVLCMLLQLYAFIHRHELNIPEPSDDFMQRVCSLLYQSLWPKALKVLVNASKSICCRLWTHQFIDWIHWKLSDGELCRNTRQMCLNVLANIADAHNDNEEVAVPLFNIAIALGVCHDNKMRLYIAEAILSKIWAVAILYGSRNPSHRRQSLLPSKVCEGVLSVWSASKVSMEQWRSLERVMSVYARRENAIPSRNAMDLVRDTAAYCVLHRLRTCFGGPTQTLAHLEAVLDRFFAFQPIDPIAFSTTKNLFLEFIGHLEICVARVTSEKADLLGELDEMDASKVVSFFRVNARVCIDWFDRIRPKLIRLCYDQKGEFMARKLSFLAIGSLTGAFQQAEHRYHFAQTQHTPLEGNSDLRTSLIALDSALYFAARPLATLERVDDLFGLQQITLAFSNLPLFRWFRSVQQLAELRYEDTLTHLDAFFEPLMRYTNSNDLCEVYVSPTTFFGCIRDYVIVCSRLRRWTQLNDFVQKLNAFEDAPKCNTIQRYASIMQLSDNDLTNDSKTPWTTFEIDELAEWDLYVHAPAANSIDVNRVTERILQEPTLEAPQLLFLGSLNVTHVEQQMKVFSLYRDPSLLDACLWSFPLFYANPSPIREEFAIHIAQLARKQRNYEFSERILTHTSTRSTYDAITDTEELVSFLLCELESVEEALPSVKEAVALSLIAIGEVKSFEVDAQLDRILQGPRDWKRLNAAVHLAPTCPSVWLAYADWCYAYGNARKSAGTQNPIQPLFQLSENVVDADPTAAFAMAMDGYNRYANLCGEAISIKSCVRFLRLLMQCEWMPNLLPKLSAYFTTCSLSLWLKMASQLVARLTHPCSLIVSELTALLCRMATRYPQSITYIIVVEALKPNPSVAIDRIMTLLRTQSLEHVLRVSSVVHELQRISVLWEEAWIMTLTKLEADVSRRASTLTKENARVAKNMTLSLSEKKALGHRKYKALMRPILKTLDDVWNETIGSARARTPHENRFLSLYSVSIDSAIDHLKQQCALSDTEDVPIVADTWAPFASLLETLIATTQDILPLDEISPILAASATQPVPLPGSIVKEPLCITRIDPNVTILKTKTKPKQLHFIASNGQSFHYLLKAREDLRLDDRVMQLLQTMNQSLGPKRSVRLYHVVPLSETAGLIQMVPNVTSFYHIYSTWKFIDDRLESAVPTAAFYAKLKEHGISQMAASRPHETLKSIYNELAGQMPRDVLKHEIMSQADDIAHASMNVERLQRSMAIMSVLGYVLGVGDRHLDNILLCQETGEALHIDFNVCFDRGRLLKVPERVPFRLTPMMKDVYGLMGTQGSFRCVLEDTLRKVRDAENRESILTLMEAFAYDPLVEWTDGMDAQNQEKSRMELCINMSLFLSRAEERRQQANELASALEKAWTRVSQPLPNHFRALMKEYQSFQTLLRRENEIRQQLKAFEAKAAVFIQSNSSKIQNVRERVEAFMEECKARHEQIVGWKLQVTEYDGNSTRDDVDALELSGKTLLHQSFRQFAHRFRDIMSSCGSYVAEYAELHRDANGYELLKEDVYFEWWKRCEKLLYRFDCMQSIELKEFQNAIDKSLWNQSTARSLQQSEQFLVEIDRIGCEMDVKGENSAHEIALCALEIDLDNLKDSVGQIKLSNAQHHRFLKLVCSQWIRTIGNRIPNSLWTARSLTCSLGAAMKLSNLSKSSLRRLNASDLLNDSVADAMNEIIGVVSSTEELYLGILMTALELMQNSSKVETPRRREIEKWNESLDSFAQTYALKDRSEAQTDFQHLCLRVSRAIRDSRGLQADKLIEEEMLSFVSKHMLLPLQNALEKAVRNEQRWLETIADWEAFLSNQLEDILPSTWSSDVGNEWFHTVESALNRVKESVEKASCTQRRTQLVTARAAMIRTQQNKVECRRRYLLWTCDQCLPIIADRIATRPQLISVLESHTAELDALLKQVNVMEKIVHDAEERREEEAADIGRYKRVLGHIREFGDVMRGILLIESSRREAASNSNAKPRHVDRVGVSLLNELIDEQISLVDERERILETEESVQQLKRLCDDANASLESVQLGKEECLERMHLTIAATSKELIEHAKGARDTIHDFVSLLQGLYKPTSALKTKDAKRTDAEASEKLGAFFTENERLGNILLKSVQALKGDSLEPLRLLLEAHERKCVQLNESKLTEWKESMEQFLNDSESIQLESAGQHLRPLLTLCLALEDPKTIREMERFVQTVQKCLELFFRVTQSVYEISAAMQSNESDPFAKSEESADTESSGKHNRFGIQVMERIHSKLNGRVQSYPQGTLSAPLSVREQAQWLIDEATSVDNLCEMYEGWTPWI